MDMKLNSRSRRSVPSKVLAGLMLALLAAAPTAVAQVGNATLQGTVKDSSGGVLPGATVTATNTQTGQRREAFSDADGRYTILNLAPGIYNVEASLQGFATAAQRDRQLLVGTTATLDFSLQISGITQEVVVTASAQTIDLSQSQVAKVIEPTTIDNLPTITRSFSDLASLSAGVVQGAQPGGGANTGQSILVGGGTSYETGIVVDGTVVANLRFGGSYANFAQDWIQEFALVSQQPGAEFGGASAGVVNAVTKSGTNTIQGRAYGFFQDASLNAVPAFATRKRDASVRRWGGLIGGPIQKDRLFFFTGYENFHNEQSITVNIPAAFVDPAVGMVNGVFPQVANSQIAMVKLNYTVDNNHSVWARWNYQYDDNTNTNLSLNRPVGAAGWNKGPTGLYAGAWDWTLSSTTVNQLRANYNRTNLVRGPNCFGLLGTYPGFPVQPGSTEAGNPIGYWGSISYPQAGGVAARCTLGAGSQVTYDTHVDETILHVRGRHQLRFGVEVRRAGFTTAPGYRSATSDPQLTINGTSPFAFNLATTALSALPVAYLARYMTIREFQIPWWAFGSFVQDNWEATPSLTLNMGLRYEHDRSGSGINRVVPADNPKVSNISDIAPRFGLAWTPSEDKKTVVRGGVGLFHDKTELNVFLAYIGDTPGVQAYRIDARRPSQNPYCFRNNLCSSGVVPAILQQYVQFVLARAAANYTLPSFPAPGTIETITIGSTTLTIPAPAFAGPDGRLIAAPVGTINPLNPDFRRPATVQTSVGVARQWTDQLNMSADFVYNRGFDQVQINNINVDPVTLQPPVDLRYTTVEEFRNSGYYRNYSLRLQSAYRSQRGDSVNVAYTLGFAYDNSVPGAQFGVGTGSSNTDPFDPAVDYGPSLIDARHVLNIAGTADVLAGIRVSPIFSFVSGLPYTATTSAAIVPGCPSYYTLCYPPGYTKNSLRGPNTMTLAARLSKEISLGAKVRVTALAEAYNLLNRLNYTSFGTNVAAANFQQPTAAKPTREFQFGLRFDY